ncbi:MAG: hypothetical protein WD294_04600 [Phycisphaeraceae bacterium]
MRGNWLSYLSKSALTCVWVLMLLLPGCSSPKSEAVETVRKFDGIRFQADAELFQQLQPDEKKASAWSVWPESFQQLDPVRVKPHMFGLLLVIEEGSDKEAGIYVVMHSTGLPPQDGSGIVHERITPRLYWVEQKIRRPVRRH